MQASSSAGANDVFLVTSAEGKLQLMSGKNGRVEKSVDAHRGACLSARFVYAENRGPIVYLLLLKYYI